MKLFYTRANKAVRPSLFKSRSFNSVFFLLDAAHFSLFASALQHSLKTAPPIQWQKSLGGSNNDDASSIQQTADGGFIVAGNSNPMMVMFQEIMAVLSSC